MIKSECLAVFIFVSSSMISFCDSKLANKTRGFLSNNGRYLYTEISGNRNSVKGVAYKITEDGKLEQKWKIPRAPSDKTPVITKLSNNGVYLVQVLALPVKEFGKSQTIGIKVYKNGALAKGYRIGSLIKDWSLVKAMTTMTECIWLEVDPSCKEALMLSSDSTRFWISTIDGITYEYSLASSKLIKTLRPKKKRTLEDLRKFLE